MKRWISMLMAAVMLISAVPFTSVAEETAASTETQPEWEYETADGGIILTAYNGTAVDVSIPATVDDQQVIALGDSLFENNDAINSVTLGTGIMEIGTKAFYDCDQLVTIVTNEELTTIGDEAFYSCDLFNSVILYDAVTSIGTDVFAECPNLTIWCNMNTAGYTYAVENGISYEILNPDATPEIITVDDFTYYIMNGEAVAIDYIGTATEVTVPAVVEGYPVTELRETFKDCTTLTAVNLPDSTKAIGTSAFYKCSSLASIVIPDGIISIGSSAFYNCRGLSSITIPDSVTSIGKSAFSHCVGLTSVTIPDSVTFIDDSVFYTCTSLTSITIPDGVTFIGNSVFYRCVGLTSIDIPESVSFIGNWTFAQCYGLTSISIPESVTSIGDSVFRDCINLASITIPDGITSIGVSVFDGCTNLRKVLIPQSVKTIATNSFLTNTVLMVYEGSYAHTFAVDNDLLYFVYDGSAEPEIITKDSFVYAVMNGEAIAIDYIGSAMEVTVPSVVDGYPVTKLWETFRDCTALTVINLPNSLTSISKESFFNCSYLSSITIPDSVTSIGDSTFYGCGRLTSVALSSGITSINNYTFYGCDGLTSITIPNGITSIGASAFYECVGLTSIAIPGSVTTIDESAFFGCSSLTSVTLSDGIASIGNSVFYKCFGLTSISIPDSVTSIGRLAFSNCTGLTSVTIPDSVTSIGRSAFSNCISLSSVIISDSITSITSSVFDGCTNLRKVLIPQSVKTITTSFPTSTILMVYDGSYAHTFAVDNDLLYFVYDGSAEPEIITKDSFVYAVMNGEAIAIDYIGTDTEITVPAIVDTYPVTELRETFRDCTALSEINLTNGIISIGNYTFYGCSGLVSITIPDSVTSIGASVFYECTRLTSITIPNAVTFIGNYAFYGCSGLTSIILSDSICTIDKWAFAHCSSLTSVIIPKSVTSISNCTFYNCSGLVSITIPDSIVSIGSSVFESCSSLSSITLPDSVTSIAESAFKGCSSLTSFILPDGITSIDDSVFYNCTSLAVVNISNSVISIGESAFYNCTSLLSISLPNSVTAIGASAFYHCTGLSSVIIPSGITTIVRSAFAKCDNLSLVTIPDSVTSIAASAFSGCTSLQKVLLPQSVESLQTTSFPVNTILMVYADSYTHTYAVENDLLYFVMRKTENPEIAYGAGISGVVTYTDGTAASGATVEIFYDDGVLKESVVTDENGAYEFTYAEVGAYTVKATDTNGNTASTQVSVKRMNAFDVFLTGDTDLTLKQGWSVTGTVSESPATVTLTDEEGDIIASATTEDGSFTLENVPNGTYIIKAETESGSVAQEVTVFDSDMTDLILTVETASATIWGYVEVEDRALNHHRRNWVQVTLYNAEGVAVDQCKSDSEGKYTFVNLPLGEYTVVAETHEMRPDRKHGFDRSHTLTGYAYVNAETAGTHQAETIVLYEENDKEATISGKVTAQGETQNCEVVLRNVFRHEVAKMTTGNNGKYTFKNVKDGLYFITATTESDGMGFTVVVVRNGIVYGETDITIYKSDKIKDRENKFKTDVPDCNSRDEALNYRDRIAEEKRHYDKLSEKEKKQLSKEYVNRLNRYSEWLANVEYTGDEEVKVENGGLVVSGDELANDDTVTFNLTVEKYDDWGESSDGVHNDRDFIHHNMRDAAGKGEIKGYYEITMTKTVDGEEKAITSVMKDTDSSGKFRITLTIPEEDRGHKHYTVLHEHHGEVVTLADLDDDPNTVTFEVDRFSSFALTATDTELTEMADAEGAGDVNGDGLVDVRDVLILLRILKGKQYAGELIESAMFVNDDAVVDVGDATLLLRKVAGWNEILTAPPVGAVIQKDTNGNYFYTIVQ